MFTISPEVPPPGTDGEDFDSPLRGELADAVLSARGGGMVGYGDLLVYPANTVGLKLHTVAAAVQTLLTNLADDTDADFGAGMLAYSGLLGYPSGSVGEKLDYTTKSLVVDFHAVGDGVTDDTVAVLAAWQAGVRVDGHGKTYKVTSGFTGAIDNSVIFNATIDANGFLTANGTLFYATGSIGTAVPLTANLTTNAVTVGSTTTFAVDGLVWLASNQVWDAATGVIFGHYGRVKSIDSPTSITLYSDVLVPFNTANAASIAPVTPVRGAGLQDVTILGQGSGSQRAVQINYGENIHIRRLRVSGFDYVGCRFYRCYASSCTDSKFEFARGVGLSYGIAVHGGCWGFKAIGNTGEDCRHTVTVGDNDGLNCFVQIIGNLMLGSKDAGVDSHSACIFLLITGNQIHMSAARFGTSNHDGIAVQGANVTITDNQIFDSRGIGVAWEPSFQYQVTNRGIIKNNLVQLHDTGYASGSGTGVLAAVIADYGADIDSVIMSGNSVCGGQHNASGVQQFLVQIYRTDGVIKRCVISENQSSQPSVNYPIWVRLFAANARIDVLSVHDNQVEAAAPATRGLYVFIDGAAATIGVAQAHDNVFTNCPIGINWDVTGAGAYIEHVSHGRNVYTGTFTATLRFDGDCRDVHCRDFDDTTFTAISGTPRDLSASLTNWFINTYASGAVITLPDPAKFPGRELQLQNNVAATLTSASSNVIPLGMGSTGTAILAATDGAFTRLRSDGTSWREIAKG